MVELQHRQPEPIELSQFRAAQIEAVVGDFDSPAFQPVKRAVKAALHAEQGGICAYCEQTLAPSAGQIDHIKPKAGPNAQPQLCFTYNNYAHSCITDQTCGQKKKNGLLPIEPAPGCNREWQLSTDGSIQPLAGLTRQRRHAVIQTRDMLGLNKDSDLVIERQKWLKQSIVVLQLVPNDLPAFLKTAPFRYILATAV